MLSGTILILKDQIINTISQFVFLSPVVLSYKGSYGSEALFGRDVDYFGGSYRTRSSYAVAKCPAAGQGLKQGGWGVHPANHKSQRTANAPIWLAYSLKSTGFCFSASFLWLTKKFEN